MHHSSACSLAAPPSPSCPRPVNEEHQVITVPNHQYVPQYHPPPMPTFWYGGASGGGGGILMTHHPVSAPPVPPPVPCQVIPGGYNTNPVGALQERFQSQGITPSYRIIQAEGASHCPIFSYQVNVGEFYAVGSGSSKKQAKHNAARNMLDILDGHCPVSSSSSSYSDAYYISSPPPTPMTATPLTPMAPLPMPHIPITPLTTSTLAAAAACSPLSVQTVDSANGSVDNFCDESQCSSTSSSSSNTIGRLQEVCVRRGLSIPIYDLAHIDCGQTHQRSFKMKVRVGRIQVEGEGGSKKEAKRDAARKMMELIQKLSAEDEEDEDEDEEELARLVEGIKIDTINTKQSTAVADFYHDLQDRPKSKLVLLHKTPLRRRPDGKTKPGFFTSLLEDLASEQGFKVTFVEVDREDEDEDSDLGEDEDDACHSEEYICLAQLSTLPVAVCYGTGANADCAKDCAARNALKYIKMMTRKKTNNGKKTNGTNGTEQHIVRQINGNK